MTLPRPTDQDMTDQDMRRRVLWRDADVIVFDKPAGLAVHKGTNTKDDLEAHFPALCFDYPEPPRLAHRLDKDTSGCLVLGRHDAALTRLGALFARQRVEKTYWAVVEGRPPLAEGRFDQPLRKLAGPRGGRMEAVADGPPAVTDYRLLGEVDGLGRLELHPRTGRTHQLRAHCALMGCPILGDATYGHGGDSGLHHGAAVGLQLHARRVSFTLRHGEAPITVEAPLPKGFALASLWGDPISQM